jgi:hypothetical protein
MSSGRFSRQGPRGRELASEELLDAMRQRREVFQSEEADA